MPPATRREVRLSASLPSPAYQDASSHTIEPSRSATFLMPNMECILENFEHFKRKHISQNREIIKQNATLNLRIRELENRILTLEDEKAQFEIATVGFKAQISQLRHAIGCIHAGWEAIGRGLTLSAGRPYSIHDADPSSHLPPSSRIAVEPNPNAKSVVCSVARAPESHISSLEEEALRARSSFVHTNDEYKDEWQHHYDTMREAQVKGSRSQGISSLDVDGAPSPMGSPELPINIEDAIAAAASRPNSYNWSIPDLPGPPSSSSAPYEMPSSAAEDFDPGHNINSQSLRRSGRKSSRRQSGYLPQPDYAEARSESPERDFAARAQMCTFRLKPIQR